MNVHFLSCNVSSSSIVIYILYLRNTSKCVEKEKKKPLLLYEEKEFYVRKNKIYYI